MKKVSLFSVFILCAIFSNAQKIKTNKIDKFTKKEVIETSFERISGSAMNLPKSVWIAFKKNGDAKFIRLKWCCKEILSISKDAQIMFLDKDGETCSFYNTDFCIAESGLGTVGIAGSALPGLDIWLLGDLSCLEGKEITDMRINTTDGYKDFKIGKSESKAISKTYQVFMQAIEK